MGIDARDQNLTFSDALTCPKPLQLARHFQGRIRVNFGIGTNLTNDFDFAALQIVIKMTRCNRSPRRQTQRLARQTDVGGCGVSGVSQTGQGIR